TLDLDKLVENLHEDKDLALRGALAFLRSFILTLPSGKQNTFAAHHPPVFIALRAGKGLPRNLATAFERLRGNPLPALSAIKTGGLP
ncbi:type I-E CRISPR-associated protein Cas7/Cse4/CasC, partial [Escherichia coli]|nr:type I-E CRISPR-associated protein Cas7/Cse4/CasC [Escherichia coli]